MSINHLVYGLVILALVSCANKSDRGAKVVEVFGNTLYSGEIDKLITSGTSFEDSVFITKEYINNWVEKQVLLHKAEQVLTASEKDKSVELEQYKMDLVTYEVLNKLAQQELDTSVQQAELEDYYESNLKEFQLSQNILKINFFKVPSDAKDLGLLWSNFKSGDESIYGKLQTASGSGGNTYTDKASWVYFDDILKEIPINTYNQEHFLNNNKYIRIKEQGFDYFVKIIDFKIRSTNSPFSMERDNIKQILLMKRQQDLVKSIETKLIQEAYNDKQIRTF